ncbi:MAG: aromatic ring-hydroxylating dioxygenase subunit alpha [Cyanobacteria bacterium P01_H01_bin.15]
MPSFPSPLPRTLDLRTCGIDPHHWYVVAPSAALTTKPLSTTLWYEEIVLFRDEQGQIHALTDMCPHRQVKLSGGTVVGDSLECAYHGWRFNGQGDCAWVPSLKRKLPNCRVKAFPVREQDGFIWIYLAAGQPREIEPLPIPEWSELNFIGSVAEMKAQAHFSYVIANLMDMHHGHLHRAHQPWAHAQLENLTLKSGRVDAIYQAQSYYRIDKIWSVLQLFLPFLRQLHPENLQVSYCYPHWYAELGEEFRLYGLLCPETRTSTRIYLLHFVSLGAFKNLHKLPVPFRRWVKNRLFNAAQGLLDALLAEDVVMIEQEQQAFQQNPQQSNREVNPAVLKAEQLIMAHSRQG